MEPTTNATDGAVRSLLSMLAAGGRATVLSLLHQRAVQTVGARCSLLFEPNPRDGELQATSGYGLEQLPSEGWHPSSGEQRQISQAFELGVAVTVPDLEREMPALRARLGTSRAVLLPLANRGGRVGLLALGVDSAAAASTAAINGSDVPASFVLALELARLRQREDMEREVRSLLDAFSERVAATLDPLRALEPLCVETSRLFAADRMSVWLHDRESRQLLLRASSDPAPATAAVAVRADDPIAPAAAALRSPRAGLTSAMDAPTSVLTVPLRGCRRALGTIVFEGVRIQPGDAIDLLDRADELGRQLASVLETVQLLDQVGHSSRELERIFSSLAHLIVVIDLRGRIVRANLAFAQAAGHSPEALRQQPLASHTGAELNGWLAGLDELLDRPAVRELTDQVLGGPYLVTVTDLVGDGARHAGRVVVASDLVPGIAELERK